MSVDAALKSKLEKKSKIYNKLKPKWDKTRTIYKGEDEVHEATIKLLPRLEQQTDTMYEAYIERTRFLNAFKRTILGLNGTVKRKEYDTNIEALKEFESNVDLAGTTLQEYSDKLLIEGLKIGVSATLVDYNHVEGSEDLTVAESEKLNLRPKLCFYISDNIYKVEYKVINGVLKKSLVVLKETYTKAIDEFESKTLDQYRILRLNEKNVYEQQLYKITEEGNVDTHDPIEPEMNNEKFDYIPFFIHGNFVEPPLYDLVTNNVKHYQLKADHNHLLHFIGLPTVVRTGVDPNDGSLPTTIGPDTVWDIENENAKAFFLALDGEGTVPITKELEAIKEDMAFLGAAILVSDSNVNETATKADYRNASETSSLADITIDLSNSFTKALILFGEWGSVSNPEEIYYNYNKDFDLNQLTAQDILARVQAWQSGAISKRSLFKQFKNGEVELESTTFEDEEELINKGE